MIEHFQLKLGYSHTLCQKYVLAFLLKIQSTIIKPARFGNQRSKEQTARMSLWRELNISAIYTMEASFCGSNRGIQNGYHFTTNSLKEIGRDLCRSLIAYCDIPLYAPVNEHKEKATCISSIKDVEFFKNIKEGAEKELISKTDTFIEDESMSGSDDSPSDGNLNEKFIKLVIPVSKNGKGYFVNSFERKK